MLKNTDIPELVECVDPRSFRVHAPKPMFFLCGGKLDVKAAVPPSLREAFSRTFYDGKRFDNHVLLIAEDLNAFFPRGHYTNILEFEDHIAQIADLIILFSESFGSAAELGAFVMEKEIAMRLMVVIDDINYGKNSFITLGPLKKLMEDYGDAAVCVLPCKDISIENIKNISTLNKDTFSQMIMDAVEQSVTTKRQKFREHTTFDASRSGHVIKLITGIIQHYGALTLYEIKVHLEVLAIELNDKVLENYLLCAEFAKWIRQERLGLSTYFISSGGNEALGYKFKDGKVIDKPRWRADVAAHWQRYDPARYQVILRALRD